MDYVAFRMSAESVAFFRQHQISIKWVDSRTRSNIRRENAEKLEHNNS